ncbi:ABC transporter ATP-binding protein [Ponticoccus sp. SC2-23]|uniref:ABC transporter ATP-binding protein n=1 Tax=Alexandriicola marinus TaxID=2081710 RepID=UPI000FD836CC|nr:ABC transporter ATP-binding protein [Alexandriicola marinus]MBM1221398.1 ABC transporter ATP-binding protein [Ponticoccus sp. SC6-9]MBM1226439.1 ABC transporter ATP-binding protein [Ponticoccus sp. SC6-15]MBM1230390.1 ABC transporter ATP-binding protein [Ponticoccus sp. SC6-38]MBM1234913.1 ABC transporter ATP-binding protein [Ponticoccus sp. SC6-45]MBM1239411.1 ABC transporter ATP-binding protein [Ponticoccus sp. SC6-49]MBM1243193.1 ABC transporter ATP-binding protein [Ponticoccus sp. SC2-
MTPPDAAPLVELRGLTKTYGEGETATMVLKGLDLTLEKGRMIALLGASGSGKSTLLNILGTLLRPTAGRFTMLGQELFGADDATLTDFRNRHIGFVFQFHNLLPDFSALENVIFPTAVREGVESAQARLRGAELLELVGLADRTHYRATKLSGGQKQRVAVARALMNKPDLILADEPTGNLDSVSAQQVMELIKVVNQREGTTFLISTHDERIAAQCEGRLEIRDGRII